MINKTDFKIIIDPPMSAFRKNGRQESPDDSAYIVSELRAEAAMAITDASEKIDLDQLPEFIKALGKTAMWAYKLGQNSALQDKLEQRSNLHKIDEEGWYD